MWAYDSMCLECITFQVVDQIEILLRFGWFEFLCEGRFLIFRISCLNFFLLSSASYNIWIVWIEAWPANLLWKNFIQHAIVETSFQNLNILKLDLFITFISLILAFHSLIFHSTPTFFRLTKTSEYKFYAFSSSGSDAWIQTRSRPHFTAISTLL